MMNNPTRLCRVDAIVDGNAIAVQIDQGGEVLDLVLLRRGDEIRAYHNVCPHAGRRLDYAPGQFLVRSGRLICAAHGATFDVDSGRCVGGPGGGGLSRVAVAIIEGEVRLLDQEDAEGVASSDDA